MADVLDFDHEEDDTDWDEIQTYNNQATINSTIIHDNQLGIKGCKEMKGLHDDKQSSETNQVRETETAEISQVHVQEPTTVGPSRMSLNDHKAGMEGLDKEKINKIILEASKGSKFYENELLKEQQVKDRILRQTEHLESCTDEEKTEAILQADKIVRELEETRDLSRIIVHIDMDAFFAAVEMRDDPSLRDKPMAVGSTGMLSTSNYPARRFGVRAAMPGFIGKKLCPELVIVPIHFDKYREASSSIRKVLREYDPNFLPMSLDEAYLDLTEYNQERQKNTTKKVFYRDVEKGSSKGEPVAFEFGNNLEEIVREIRFRIERETKLTASAGIACNQMLAKVCTDRNKPNGQYYLLPDRDHVLEFVRDLPIRKISGIGRVSEQMLKAVGIVTCNDLFVKRDLLVLLHSSLSARFLIGVCLGLGATKLESTRERKSLSTERTFTEISNPKQLLSECQKLCTIIAEECKSEKLMPRTVTLKLKTIKFEVKTRALSLPKAISSEEEIWKAARDLLAREIKLCEPNLLRLRLMGVQLSKFENFEKKDTKQDRITSFLQKGSESKGSVDAMKHQTLGLGSEVCASNVFESMPSTSAMNQNEASYFEGVCPVCNKLQVIKESDYLSVFNDHVDICLNAEAIREVLNEDRQKVGQTQPEVNQECAVGKGKGTKRKQGNTKDVSKSKKATLERFWTKP